MESKPCVLVIDDNDDNRFFVERLLEEEGYAVTSVADGETALSVVDKQPFAIIIMDVMLPGKSGVQVTWEMRERGIQTPVIATTAYLEKWDRDDLYDCGVTMAIEKPIERSVLVDAIKRILSGEYLRDGGVY